MFIILLSIKNKKRRKAESGQFFSSAVCHARLTQGWIKLPRKIEVAIPSPDTAGTRLSLGLYLLVPGGLLFVAKQTSRLTAPVVIGEQADGTKTHGSAEVETLLVAAFDDHAKLMLAVVLHFVLDFAHQCRADAATAERLMHGHVGDVDTIIPHDKDEETYHQGAVYSD